VTGNDLPLGQVSKGGKAMISVRNAGAGRSLLAIAGVILGVSFAGAATRTWTTPASACQRLLPAEWDTGRVCLRDAVLKTARKGQWFGDGCRNLALSLFFIEPDFCDWPSSSVQADRTVVAALQCDY